MQKPKSGFSLQGILRRAPSRNCIGYAYMYIYIYIWILIFFIVRDCRNQNYSPAKHKSLDTVRKHNTVDTKNPA